MKMCIYIKIPFWLHIVGTFISDKFFIFCMTVYLCANRNLFLGHKTNKTLKVSSEFRLQTDVTWKMKLQIRYSGTGNTIFIQL